MICPLPAFRHAASSDAPLERGYTVQKFLSRPKRTAGRSGAEGDRAPIPQVQGSCPTGGVTLEKRAPIIWRLSQQSLAWRQLGSPKDLKWLPGDWRMSDWPAKAAGLKA